MIPTAVLIRTYTRLPPTCTRQSSKQRRGQAALASFLCLSSLLTPSSIHFEQVCKKDFQHSFCTQTETLHLLHRGPAMQLSAGTIHLAPSHLSAQVWAPGAALRSGNQFGGQSCRQLQAAAEHNANVKAVFLVIKSDFDC